MPDIKVNLNRTRLRLGCLLLSFRLRFAIDQRAYFGSGMNVEVDGYRIEVELVLFSQFLVTLLL